MHINKGTRIVSRQQAFCNHCSQLQTCCKTLLCTVPLTTRSTRKPMLQHCSFTEPKPTTLIACALLRMLPLLLPVCCLRQVALVQVG